MKMNKFFPFVLATALLALAILPAQADKSSLHQARGTVVAKGDSTFKMNVRGDVVTFRISPDLLPLVGARGDSAHVVVELIGGKWKVKYVVKRLSGTVTYSRRNLREDFHIVQDASLDRPVAATWADSTIQFIGDPSEWIGRKVNWEEVWIEVDKDRQYYLGYIRW